MNCNLNKPNACKTRIHKPTDQVNELCVKKTDLLILMDSIDNNINDNIDFIQSQLNLMTNATTEVLNEMMIENNRYKTVINEINKINDVIDCLTIEKHRRDDDDDDDKKSNCSDPCHGCRKIIYTDTSTIHTLVITKNISFIYLTMVAGGGAGGLGYIQNMFYYSGGGGGSGACVVNKPVPVCENTIIRIKVGAGADMRNDTTCGEDSYVEIICPVPVTGVKTTNINKGCDCSPSVCQNQTIIVKGGCNSHPCNNQDPDVTGGAGGANSVPLLSGSTGDSGAVSLPSLTSAIGGNGAASALFAGGSGAANYFSTGGTGGTIDNLIGSNGSYGSGGGGSCPKSIIDSTNRLSGNGGDGVVIIELCN